MWARAAIPGYKHTSLTIIYVNLLVSTALMYQAQQLKLAYEAAMAHGFSFPTGCTLYSQTLRYDFCNTDS